MEEQIKIILNVLTPDQLLFFALQLDAARRDAVSNRAEQRIVIVINDKGYPRYLDRMVGMRFPEPRSI